MKLTVAQVMHIDKSVKKLAKDIDDRFKAAKSDSERADLKPLADSIYCLENHVNQLMGAEFTIKG